METMIDRKPTDRRKQVLEAASRSFAAFGYKATTMDQVAKAAGVGKGTIYTFFANKEELFEQIVKDLIAELKAVAERTLDPALPFSDNLLGILQQVLAYRDRHGLVVKLSQEVKEFGTPMAKGGLEAVERSIVDYIAGHVSDAIAKGEVRRSDPALTAYMMLKMYLALTAEGDHLHEPLDAEQVLAHFRFYCLEGLAVV
ncbi:TetR/AcrR family transcriptional regulator [Cohnella hashimotonis]|uniref:TetR/AcrR family transcriptional regulator n=1 Tax=Cohnella hashimotonis TaxID=2826895 RepID=A0ABT6TBC3_9BACL|nr:TetR/AcrR family transcriptional regulator [Cohnella hashimotonis]MDI4644137.1 TetR/AcrR family transcriptional regulator [Cohnella hashimotonis]